MSENVCLISKKKQFLRNCHSHSVPLDRRNVISKTLPKNYPLNAIVVVRHIFDTFEWDRISETEQNLAILTRAVTL